MRAPWTRPLLTVYLLFKQIMSPYLKFPKIQARHIESLVKDLIPGNITLVYCLIRGFAHIYQLQDSRRHW